MAVEVHGGVPPEDVSNPRPIAEAIETVRHGVVNDLPMGVVRAEQARCSIANIGRSADVLPEGTVWPWQWI